MEVVLESGVTLSELIIQDQSITILEFRVSHHFNPGPCPPEQATVPVLYYMLRIYAWVTSPIRTGYACRSMLLAMFRTYGF